MPTTKLIPVTTSGEILIYDGTNSTDMAALCTGMNIDSDNGTTCTWHDDASNNYSLAIGDAVQVFGGTASGALTASQLQHELVPVARFGEAAAAGPVAFRLGLAAVPGPILLNGQATVQVPFSPGFADTDYQVQAALTGGIGSLQILSATIINAGRVDVVVKAVGLLYGGCANLTVLAIHN